MRTFSPPSISPIALRPFTLEWLLHPVTPASFFDNYWERQALFINRGMPNYFGGLPGLQNIDEIITATSSHSSRADDVRLIKTDRKGVSTERKVQSSANGVPDIQLIYREYARGCSVGINHIHRRSSSVALLCNILEADLHHHVGANLYLTPPGRQGLRPHFDTHDVLVLQLHGTKEWHVGGSRAPLPLVSMKEKVKELSEDSQTFTLQAGDLLYLPRGLSHFAKSNASSSLHLTVRIEVFRWADFLCEALRELSEDHSEFRTALPPGFGDISLDAAHISRLAENLKRSMDRPDFLERTKARLVAKLLHENKAASKGQFASIDAITNLSPASVVVRQPGTLCRVRETSDAVIIDFCGNFVSGPPTLKPTLDFIAEREKFLVRDLPGNLSESDKVDLVAYMVGEGLLQLSQ